MRTHVVLAALLLAAPAWADEKKAEKLKSGLELKAGVPAFEVHDVTGPNAAQTLCYR